MRRRGDVYYLDPKLMERGSVDSSLRTFYFEPKDRTLKILDDATHLLIGIEHDGNDGDWEFLGYRLVDLSKLKVRLKAEFQASNRDMYNGESVLEMNMGRWGGYREMTKETMKRTSGSVAMDDYLEQILHLIDEKGYARAVDVSTNLGISQASVTNMFQKLDAEGLVKHVKYRGTTLTEEGRRIAGAIVERHETLTRFLRLFGLEEENHLPGCGGDGASYFPLYAGGDTCGCGYAGSGCRVSGGGEAPDG